jgi:hypothetical protein
MKWRGVPFLLILAGLSAAACSDDRPLAPSAEVFALPSDAPADAAAPTGATRVLVTAIQIFTADGRLANPAALQGNAVNRFRAWIFCPRGLEGGFDYAIPAIGLSGSGERLMPGYNSVSDGVFIPSLPGSYPFRFDVIREFVTVASKEITLVVRP